MDPRLVPRAFHEPKLTETTVDNLRMCPFHVNCVWQQTFLRRECCPPNANATART